MFSSVQQEDKYLYDLLLTRSQSSLVAQLRAGIRPLALEVAGFKNIQQEDSLCKLGDIHNVDYIFFCIVLILEFKKICI